MKNEEFSDFQFRFQLTFSRTQPNMPLGDVIVREGRTWLEADEKNGEE